MNSNPTETRVVNLIFILLSLLMLAPFALVVIISLTGEADLIQNGYRFVPDRLVFTAYEYIFKVPSIIVRSYGVTAAVTVIGTVSGLLVTAMIAYAISRPDYGYRRVTSFYVFFTMLFSGGLIPYYILMTQYLHLKDTIWAMILPGMLSAWNVMVLKGFLAKIPMEIIESAKMDGAGEWRIFFTVVIPLSTPALATMGLLIAFWHWNDWLNALLFIDSQKLVPLQLLLVRMLSSMEVITQNLDKFGIGGLDVSKFPTMSVRMAMVVLAAGPMMVVFPFFQRYFVQGLTVGSLKG
ncbi:carbohydrate ABC transporter permease [Cohnella zeiphila]|uniref:Carbohydrate ABC transporter permease n=1 Tax=Cohnella zeiphila TaxID=2761120 RepID=A0A7X0STR2_9BACL|nr:carbohydrate ABC transporter permease [Cohnella zeiphila]MBB6735928.1 carbohydrate ABC transporter permease [Cohnella zeiphila]